MGVGIGPAYPLETLLLAIGTEAVRVLPHYGGPRKCGVIMGGLSLTS